MHDYSDGISRFRGWAAEYSPTICQVIASLDSSMGYDKSMGSYALAEECAQPVFAETVALKRLQRKAFSPSDALRQKRSCVGRHALRPKSAAMW
jgi:hypothetical protein